MIGDLKKPELLAPAGSPETLEIALKYGADAVYIGGEAYGLRAAAKNFGNKEMKEAVNFAHSLGKKVYVTANILAHNEDLSGVEKYFADLNEIKPDAVIVADPGVFTYAKKILKDIDIHISTQSNNVNFETFNFWHSLGATRVVAGRELSLEEIGNIRNNISDDLEIEAFIHGAMCISYSGRCLLSNYMTGRDANKGACTHPCRWRYSVVEEQRPGEYFPVFENERGTFIFNSKDLSMIEHIPELVGAGIDSFKIEGRMKTALYIATVVRAYRSAIDDYFESEEKYRERMPFYMREINSASRRKYTTGFFLNKAGEESVFYEDERQSPDIYLGTVKSLDDDGYAVFEQKNKFAVGDEIELITPAGENITTKVVEMCNERGEKIEACARPKEIIRVKLSKPADVFYILRKASEPKN